MRAKLASCRKPLWCRRMQTRSAALLEGVHTSTRLLGTKWYTWEAGDGADTGTTVTPPSRRGHMMTKEKSISIYLYSGHNDGP